MAMPIKSFSLGAKGSLGSYARDWGLGFRVWGLGFWGLGFGVVWGLGFRVWGLGFGVWGFAPPPGHELPRLWHLALKRLEEVLPTGLSIASTRVTCRQGGCTKTGDP